MCWRRSSYRMLRLSQLWLKYLGSGKSQYHILDVHYVHNMVQAIRRDKESFVGVHEWAYKNFKACISEVSLIVVVYGKRVALEFGWNW